MDENRACDTFGTGTTSLGVDLLKTSKTSLNQKYSVHNNDEDLMADFERIMDDIGASTPKNGSNIATGSSNKINNSNNNDKMESEKTIDSATIRANGNALSGVGVTNGDDRSSYVMEWANGVRCSQSSQSMSMQVASILSDHDYLSQENMQDIKTENESKNNLANETQNMTNESVDDEAKESDAIVENGVDSGNSANDINDLSDMVKLLSNKTNKAQSAEHLKKIAAKINAMRSNMIRESIDDPDDNNSAFDVEFAPNHSEPMEYDGKNVYMSSSDSEEGMI